MKSKNPTMTDIARTAGVSQSTVSMILSGKQLSSFPPATVAKVQEACKALNYVPRKRNSSKSSRKSKEILVLASKMTNPYYPSMLQSVEREALRNGLSVVACDTYYMPDLEKQYLKMASERDFLAAIFLYAPVNLSALKKYNPLLPVVAICDYGKNSTPTDLVELNNLHAGRLAAEHLYELGHRRYTLLTNTVDGSQSREARLVGIQQYLESVPEPCKIQFLKRKAVSAEDAMSDNYDYNTGYQLAQDVSIYQEGSTAIIAMNDMVALGAMDAVLEKGYRVPEDFSIIGFDNLLYTGLARISLTTVDNHTDLLAKSAMDVLLYRINISNNSPLISETYFKIECQPRLIVRKSTGPAASAADDS